MERIAFDSEKYISMQSARLMERVNRFNNKLYLEFGGKLFDDSHASRVLPGFEPDMKVKMLTSLKDKVEIIIAINAHDIEKSKKRGDLGITYDQDVLRLIDAFRNIGLYVGSVVITQYVSLAVVDNFKRQLEKMNITVYLHYAIDGYPSNIDLIVSDDGFGKNDYVETTRPLVVVTAPGPGSGKMAVCLSQLYHEYKRNNVAGYAKFETFPIFNLPLNHPVNLAYEAATVDLNDVNMIDPFHLEKYGVMAVNYNRDVEIFPVLARILKQITNQDVYFSPTDMGVNMIGYCICDDEASREASCDEIIRRYYRTLVDYRLGNVEESAVNKAVSIMNKANITVDDYPVVKAALQKAEMTNGPAVALQLSDGHIVTGKNSSLLGAASACIINALKYLCNIADGTLLLSPNIIAPVQDLKVNYLGNNNPRLHVDEVLIALTISAQLNPAALQAISALPKLKNAKLHSSVILSAVDNDVLRKLGVMVSCEPKYQTKKLYHPHK